jgi:tetratricopeptide (TPR) repeat protein
LDGKAAGVFDTIYPWERARLILDEMRSRPDRDPDPARHDDVRLWYRATTASLLLIQQAELSHFSRGVELFPEDPVLVFAKAAIRDMATVPAVHQTLRRARSGFGSVMNLGSQDREMGEAEELFEKATELDAGYAEARLRRGRLLGRLGKHQEAAGELRRALAGITEPLLEYYGQLFLGR